MALSIKDPETDNLARQLVEITGETITEAITIALRERLERLEHNSKVVRVAKVLELLDLFKERIPVGVDSSDHADLLYGEDGLPK